MSSQLRRIGLRMAFPVDGLASDVINLDGSRRPAGLFPPGYHAVMAGPVFISFSHDDDAGYARRLAAHLAAQGLPSLYDTQPMTDTWWTTYTRAQIDGSGAVVVVMTPAAARSGWVARELEHAARQGKPILPLLLARTPFPALDGLGHEDVSSSGLPGPDFTRRLHEALGIAPAPQTGVGDAAVPLHGGVTGAAVGIEVRGGTFLPLIPAGTAVPHTHAEHFTTADDGQPVIGVRVFRGDTASVAGHRLLRAYELVLEHAPAGVPQIRVSFQVDAAGTFRLSAADAAGRDVPVRELPTS